MSFGDGNLHDEVDRLKDVNGSLCGEKGCCTADEAWLALGLGPR